MSGRSSLAATAEQEAGLPRYAPELNDIERSWRDLERHYLAHRTFRNAADFGTSIRNAFKHLNKERRIRATSQIRLLGAYPGRA